MKNIAVCVTGTDTDAGKTLVAAALLRAAASMGFRVKGIKPVQTGCVPSACGGLAAPDTAVYAEACPDASLECFARFRAACSPHLAAELEADKNTLSLLEAENLSAAIKRSLEGQRESFAVIEAAGGLLAPLNKHETMQDLFKALDFPVILVVANRLGAINHALLSLAVLKVAGVEVAGFISTTPQAPASENANILADNPETITRMSGIPCLAELPFMPALAEQSEASAKDAAWEMAASLLKPLIESLAGGSPAQKEDADLLRFDHEHIWHPYTSAVKPLPVQQAASTKGACINFADGRSLVDGMSSWWCAIHGYNHPELLSALKTQADIMPHVMFGGLTHEPAVKLARKLVDLAPGGLSHVFFSDSGSVAVEVAVKMAVQYQHAQGKPERSAMMTVMGGYHGDTLGAMSVCDPVTGMHTLFSGILPQQIFAPKPDCRFDSAYDPAPALAFEKILKENAHRIAAVILEPIVQGAGGMWFYHPDFLRRVKELCLKYDCLLIMDEIATGFGRSGKLFACQWAGVAPDIMCVGKALTGGIMTLAATLATSEVAEGISSGGGVLMHGPTFMANPLACAVACKSLELLASSNWEDKVSHIEENLWQGLKDCRSLPGVTDARVLGAIGVLEMDRPVNVEKAQKFFIDEYGVWLRPFGRNIYTMPPYIISDEQLESITRAMKKIVQEEKWV